MSVDTREILKGNFLTINTTKEVAIRHVATVAVTVATWPDSHVSY
jgi:hypothetical protein